MFCPRCGNKLLDNAKFCDKCGNPVGSVPNNPSVHHQTPAQTPVSEQSIQTAAKQAASAAASQVRSAAAEAVRTPLSNLTEQIASSQPGEAVLGTFGGVSGAVTNSTEILSPFKTILSGIKSFGQSFVGLFKNKQRSKLIIAGVIAVVWVVMMILSHNGIHIGILNFLTFAQGGVGRTVSGWLGGLLGKTTVVTMFFSLFTGGFKSLGGGFKSIFSGANFKTSNLVRLLLGAGGALIVYQFFAGSASLTDTMPAISGALIGVMALGRGNGFLYRFAQSLTASKVGASRIANNEKAAGLLSGVTYGFALGALLSAIPFGWLPVIFGGVCVIAGIVLTIVFGNKKEATAV